MIGLLSSRCTESQREAALLLGQFATATVTGNEDYKVPNATCYSLSRVVQKCRQLAVQTRSSIMQLMPVSVAHGAPDMPLSCQQPVIHLSEQIHTANLSLQARIVQRGAVPPLITMLGQTDVQLKEMGAFALGRLAQNADNQAGIVQVRNIAPCRRAISAACSAIVANTCKAPKYRRQSQIAKLRLGSRSAVVRCHAPDARCWVAAM